MFKLEFETDNDAFANDPREEIGRILERVQNLVFDGYTNGPLQDRNGNTVGRWEFTP